MEFFAKFTNFFKSKNAIQKTTRTNKNQNLIQTPLNNKNRNQPRNQTRNNRNQNRNQNRKLRLNNSYQLTIPNKRNSEYGGFSQNMGR